MAQPTATRPGWAWQIALVSSLLLVAGCASIKITDRDEYKGTKLARPDRILVHDFAATVDDLPEWSEAAKVHAGAFRGGLRFADVLHGPYGHGTPLAS